MVPQAAEEASDRTKWRRVLASTAALLAVAIVAVVAYPWVAAEPIREGSVSARLEDERSAHHHIAPGSLGSIVQGEGSYRPYKEALESCYSDYLLQRRRAWKPGLLRIAYYHDNVTVIRDAQSRSRIIVRFTGTGPRMDDFTIYYLYDLTERKIVGVERGWP